MSFNIKKIFLILCVVVPFLFYCIYYYGMILKDAPFKFKEFKSFSIQYGTGDSLLNRYDSATGQYQYLNKHDSVVKMHMLLTTGDKLVLHQKAAQLGFWDFPSDERNPDTSHLHGVKPPRYIIQYNYLHTSKKVIFDANYLGPQKLVDANLQMVKEIQAVLNGAEARQKK